MKYLMTENGSSCDLRLSGKLSYADQKCIQSLISKLQNNKILDFSVDLSGLKKIDSSGLGMLLMVNDAAQDCGQKVCLCGATGQVQKMLELSKFSQIVSMKP